MIILRTVRDNSSALQLTLFTNGMGWVLRGPLHFSPIEITCVLNPTALSQIERLPCCGARSTVHKWKRPCVAGPSALFTNRKVSVLRGPRHYSQAAERTVCCGSRCTIQNDKDSVLRGPRLYSQMERTVCCGSLLPRATWTGPSLTSLKMAMASWWVRPATERPFTEKISSPKQGLCFFKYTSHTLLQYLLSLLWSKE